MVDIHNLGFIGIRKQLAVLAPQGFACAFDAVCGPQVLDIAESIASGGRIIIHGALSNETTPFLVQLTLKRSLVFRDYAYTEVSEHPQALARAHRFIVEGIEAGMLRPCIDNVFALADVVTAHVYLASNQQFEEVVMKT